MKKFGKIINGNLIYAPDELTIKNTVYCPPSEEIYRNSGYKEIVVNIEENKNCYITKQKLTEDEFTITLDWELVPMTNDEVKQLREFQYQIRTDQLYLKYQMELSRNNINEANELLVEWTNTCNIIKQEYPYFNN